MPNNAELAPNSSFSGADITVTVYISPEKLLSMNAFDGGNLQSYQDLLPPEKYNGVITENGGFAVVGNMQTLTISSVRSREPVRRLGETYPKEYTGGSRTIAGSMIFSLLDRSAFSEVYRLSRSENIDEEFYIDMLPPMTLFITGANESGQFGRQVIDGVRLVNFGTTYSIEDLYTEQQYSYVATYASPFLRDISNPAETQTSTEFHPENSRITLVDNPPTPLSSLITRGMWPSPPEVFAASGTSLRRNSRDRR